MRLLTNSNNINSLKLLIAADVAGQQLEVAYLAPGRDSRYPRHPTPPSLTPPSLTPRHTPS